MTRDTNPQKWHFKFLIQVIWSKVTFWRKNKDKLVLFGKKFIANSINVISIFPMFNKFAQ